MRFFPPYFYYHCVIGLALLVLAGDLRLEVIEGDHAVHNVHSNRKPNLRVRVTDSTGQPIPGASVTFVLPSAGPSGEFTSGAKSFSTLTSDDGEARSPAIRINRLPGSWECIVLVSAHEHTARMALQQVNASPGGGQALRTSHRLWWAVAIGAGVAAGTGMALSGGARTAAAPPPPPLSGGPPVISIQPGTGAIGRP